MLLEFVVNRTGIMDKNINKGLGPYADTQCFHAGVSQHYTPFEKDYCFPLYEMH